MKLTSPLPLPALNRAAEIFLQTQMRLHLLSLPESCFLTPRMMWPSILHPSTYRKTSSFSSLFLFFLLIFFFLFFLFGNGIPHRKKSPQSLECCGYCSFKIQQGRSLRTFPIVGWIADESTNSRVCGLQNNNPSPLWNLPTDPF